MSERGRRTTTIKTIRFIENAEINIYDALDGFFLLKYPLLMTGFWKIIGCRSGRAYSIHLVFFSKFLLKLKVKCVRPLKLINSALYVPPTQSCHCRLLRNNKSKLSIDRWVFYCMLWIETRCCSFEDEQPVVTQRSFN